MPPEASVIIPTYNGSELIRACLEAVSSQQTSKHYEIIVVDDGSTDNTPEMVREYPGVRLFQQENAGPAAARNHGANEARGKIILFTDDDCIPEPDWLEYMLLALADDVITGAKGAYLTRQPELIARFIQYEYEEKYARLQRLNTIDLIDTYSAAFRRDIFLENGGYDTSFPYASVEDREFSVRLAAKGYRFVFQSQARVWHKHADSLREYICKKYKNGYWNVMTLAKNPSMARGTSDTPFTQKAQIILAGLLLPCLVVAGFIPMAWSAPVAVICLFLATSAPLILRCLRQDVPVGLLAPIFILCRGFSLAAGLFMGFLNRNNWKKA
ncbi:MAG: glycosyltransferase [Planctomycetes bacterium]|nr:glycosyltransferase [Planctomycetota bacterium]